MDLPQLVERELGDEPVVSRVTLGGGDAVVVTASRTLVYRSEGLLSNEGVEAFPHDVDRLAVREGRRKTTFELTDIDGTRDFSVPGDRTSAVLEPLLGGVLRANGVVERDESVQGVYRFSELTLVVTDRRAVKHVGSALWDEEFEELPFADLTRLTFEEGSVATQAVIEVDGRPERIKIPTDTAPRVRRTIEDAVFAFHGVDSLDALNRRLAPEEDDSTGETADAGPDLDATRVESADEFEPLVDAGEGGTTAGEADADAGRSDRAGDAGSTGSTGDTASAGGTDGSGDADLAREVAALREQVARQADLLERQQDLVEQLVEELRRGR